MSSHIINSFASRALDSPYSCTLGLGLGMISYYCWGNIASQNMGSIALAIYPEERKKVALDTSKAVEIFAWGYKKGAKHMGISAAVAGFAALAAAFQTPPTGLPFSPRNYLLLLAPLHLANGVHTLLFMLPTNLRLLALREKATKKDSSLTLSDEQEVETLLRKWKRLHYVRLALGAVGWVATLAVYMATV